MAFNPFIACGLTGAAVLIAAYFSNVRGWLPSSGLRFPAANLGGSLLIMVSLYDTWNLPSMVIEAFWAAISLYGMLRNLRLKA